MMARELNPFRSLGMAGSSGPLQQRRMISMFSGSERVDDRPDDVVGVVDVDVVVDDDDVPAEISAGPALAGDERRLLGVAGIALLDLDDGEKR